MAHTVLLGNDTWYRAPKGRGTPIVLLHGGLSSSAGIWRSVGKRLARRSPVAVFDRRGHGRSADTGDDFSYSAMADETVAFLEFLGRPCHLLGYSDGGIIALLVAMRRPDLVGRLILVGANFDVDGLHPLPPMTTTGPEYESWAARYASESPMGSTGALSAFERGRELFDREPHLSVADIATVQAPALVLVGDDDVVRVEHTVELFEALPEAQLAVIPGASHAVLKEHTDVCVRLIRRFLKMELPPVTYQPVRRRPAQP